MKILEMTLSHGRLTTLPRGRLTTVPVVGANLCVRPHESGQTHRSAPTLHSRNGSSLMVALFAITILAMLAIIMVSRGTAGMRDTRAFRDHQSSFQAAEAGVEHARNQLNNGATNTWDDELSGQYGLDLITGVPGAAGTADDVPFIAETILVAGQTYSVRIEDNTDDDPSPVIDEDNRIWIISTGTAGGKTTTIRELVRNNAQDSHISQEHYGEHSLGWATTE